MKMNTPYTMRKERIEKLLKEIQTKLQEHEKNATGVNFWGSVGDLGKVEEELKEIRLFLGA